MDNRLIVDDDSYRVPDINDIKPGDLAVFGTYSFDTKKFSNSPILWFQVSKVERPGPPDSIICKFKLYLNKFSRFDIGLKTVDSNDGTANYLLYCINESHSTSPDIFLYSSNIKRSPLLYFMYAIRGKEEETIKYREKGLYSFSHSPGKIDGFRMYDGNGHYIYIEDINFSNIKEDSLFSQLTIFNESEDNFDGTIEKIASIGK